MLRYLTSEVLMKHLLQFVLLQKITNSVQGIDKIDKIGDIDLLYCASNYKPLNAVFVD